VLEQYTRWAKYEVARHFDAFKKDKFFSTMTNSLLAYEFVFKPALHVRFETCDRFMQGAFVPEADQIILCSNVLTEQQDFNNAIKRMLVRMYDIKRSVDYNFDNCKHLACTEVRAALFHSECNINERSKLSVTRVSKDRQDANEFCVREKAIEFLSERNKCSAKADRYVNYVFEKCKIDYAPFSAGKSQRGVKNLTTIL